MLKERKRLRKISDPFEKEKLRTQKNWLNNQQGDKSKDQMLFKDKPSLTRDDKTTWSALMN